MLLRVEEENILFLGNKQRLKYLAANHKDPERIFVLQRNIVSQKNSVQLNVLQTSFYLGDKKKLKLDFRLTLISNKIIICNYVKEIYEIYPS